MLYDWYITIHISLFQEMISISLLFTLQRQLTMAAAGQWRAFRVATYFQVQDTSFLVSLEPLGYQFLELFGTTSEPNLRALNHLGTAVCHYLFWKKSYSQTTKVGTAVCHYLFWWKKAIVN